MATRMFIDGRWTEGRAERSTEVRSPATGEILGTVPVSTPGDVAEAARSARGGLEAMETMTEFDRARLLHRAAEPTARTWGSRPRCSRRA